MMKQLLLVLALVISLGAVSSQAEDVMSLGPKEGQTIPHRLSTVDQDGAAQEFAGMAGQKGLIVLFNRSVSWCPFCQNQVIDWNENRQQFIELGYQVVTIVPEKPELTKRFSELRNIGVTILSDPNSEIIDAFGIRDETVRKSNPFYGIPRPYIYVVAPNGTITHRFAEEDFSERPPVSVVYKAIAG